MRAIIVSAGQGKRLLPLTADRPKCLVPLAEASLLAWQVQALIENDVDDIVIVTGFGAEKVERAVASLSTPGVRIRTLYNPFYAVSDNLASCFLARGEMTGEFILLNGDTVFEPAVLQRVLAEAKAPITVTIDRKARYDSDDMKVQIADGRLARIGKTLPLESVDGESIGLLLFRSNGPDRFVQTLESFLRGPDGLKSWYLSAIDRLAETGMVGVVSIEGLSWSELDFPADLPKAEAVIRGWQAAAAQGLKQAAQR